MGADDLQSVANLDPRCMIGRIYVRLVISEKNMFLSIISLRQIMTRPRRGLFGPKGHGWQDL